MKKNEKMGIAIAGAIIGVIAALLSSSATPPTWATASPASCVIPQVV